MTNELLTTLVERINDYPDGYVDPRRYPLTTGDIAGIDVDYTTEKITREYGYGEDVERRDETKIEATLYLKEHGYVELRDAEVGMLMAHTFAAALGIERRN